MEVITIDSQAYKELVSKINAIADYSGLIVPSVAVCNVPQTAL